MKVPLKILRKLIRESLEYADRLEKQREYLKGQAREAMRMAERNPGNDQHYQMIVQKNNAMIAKITDNLRAMKMGQEPKYAID